MIDNPSSETYAKKAAKKDDRKSSQKSNNQRKPEDKDCPPSQILWVGDSHSNSLDRNAFENLTNTKVDIAIAYTADSDADARYPERNLIKIVPERLSNKKYDTLVLQGGCNEISNVNVNQNFKPEDVKLWEEKVHRSRTKIFQIAEESLERNKDLKKVIIVASLPRYDPEDRDPLAIKAKLNHYGNSVYTSLWMQKGCPANISIQDQKLDCQGELRDKRFGNPAEQNLNGKPWDGIHLRGKLGPRHYTNSMAKIFAYSFPRMKINWSANQSGDGNFHKSCAQASYQRRHFVSFRPADQGNYRQQRRVNNYQRSNGDDFSHQRVQEE